MWIIDFGVDMSETEAALYEAPFEYVREHVRPERDDVARPTHRERWWLHERAAARACGRRSPASPATSRRRDCRSTGCSSGSTAGRFPTSQLIVVRPRRRLHLRRPALARPRALGARARARSSARSSPASATRPRPASRPSRSRDPTPEQRERVGEAARRLVELRDGWLNPPGLDPADLAKRTLTNLYNQRPTWLANAHADLDAAVFAAYGWPADLPDTEILERLLALNLERAAAQETVEPRSTEGDA